jgi:hypothetical protein
MLIVRQASVEVSAPQGILLESRCYVFRGPPPPGAIVPEPGESVAPAVMSLRDAEKALSSDGVSDATWAKGCQEIDDYEK